jgi:hypothetical protein
VYFVPTVTKKVVGVFVLRFRAPLHLPYRMPYSVCVISMSHIDNV